ncbi:MAG: hypothetical protein R2807_05830 [Chitinophagales bacterium]
MHGFQNGKQVTFEGKKEYFPVVHLALQAMMHKPSYNQVTWAKNLHRIRNLCG